MLPNEPSYTSNQISSSSSTSLLPEVSRASTTPAAAAAEPTTSHMTDYSRMFATLAQLQSELEVERRQREALEKRQRELALHLYFVVAEQIKGIRAIKKLIMQGFKDNGGDERVRMMLMREIGRMKEVWGKENLRCFKVAKRRVRRRRMERSRQ